MSKHSSWEKYGRRFSWKNVLTADEIKLIPALESIAGYDASEGKFYPKESREGLVNFVVAHPEFDLVTQMDSGSTVYGLEMVNRDWYMIGLRGKAGRTQWLG
jgi:hypothetical protein